MAFFGSMAGSVPYIAKDSVTGVLSHQDDRDGGQIGMVISTLIYAAFFLRYGPELLWHRSHFYNKNMWYFHCCSSRNWVFD